MSEFQSFSPKRSAADYLKANRLTPVIINSVQGQAPDPDAGLFFLALGEYRLPFPPFPTIQDAAIWVSCHPVLVALAVCVAYEAHSSASSE